MKKIEVKIELTNISNNTLKTFVQEYTCEDHAAVQVSSFISKIIDAFEKFADAKKLQPS